LSGNAANYFRALRVRATHHQTQKGTGPLLCACGHPLILVRAFGQQFNVVPLLPASLLPAPKRHPAQTYNIAIAEQSADI